MYFGYAVFEPGALNLIFNLAIPQSAFKSDELPLLEGFCELGEITPGEDAMPFGASFVVAFVVLPAPRGCDVEGDVLFAILSGFWLRCDASVAPALRVCGRASSNLRNADMWECARLCS